MVRVGEKERKSGGIAQSSLVMDRSPFGVSPPNPKKGFLAFLFTHFFGSGKANCVEAEKNENKTPKGLRYHARPTANITLQWVKMT